MSDVEAVREELIDLTLFVVADDEELTGNAQRFASHALASLDASEHSIISPSTLAEFSSAIKSVKTNLDKAATSQSVQQQAAARNQLMTRELGKLTVLAGQLPGAGEEGATAVGSQLRLDASAELHRIRQQAEAEAQAIRSSHEAELEATRAQLEKVEAEIEARQAALRDDVDAVSAETEKLRAQIADQAVTAQLKADAAVEVAEKRLATKHAEFETELESITAQRKSIETLAGELGGHAAAYDYSNRAKHEEDRADKWAIAATILFGVTILLGIIQLLASTPDVAGAIARVALAVVIVGAGGYCFRMSAEHRRTQRRYSALALQLATLPPYLAPLDTKDAHEVRKALVTIYFNGFDAIEGPTAPQAQEAAIEAVNKALDIASDGGA